MGDDGWRDDQGKTINLTSSIEENAERFTQLLPFYPCTNFSIFADLSLMSEWVQKRRKPPRNRRFSSRHLVSKLTSKYGGRDKKLPESCPLFSARKEKAPGPRPRGFFFLCYDVTNDKNSSWCSALYTIYTIISFF